MPDHDVGTFPFSGRLQQGVQIIDVVLYRGGLGYRVAAARQEVLWTVARREDGSGTVVGAHPVGLGDRGQHACSDGFCVVLHVSARSWAPATNTTVGRPLPWHSMYIWRPPISTRPAKSLLWPELPLPGLPLAESLGLRLLASAGTAAANTRATIAASNITFLDTLSPRYRLLERLDGRWLSSLSGRAARPTRCEGFPFRAWWAGSGVGG